MDDIAARIAANLEEDERVFSMLLAAESDPDMRDALRGKLESVRGQKVMLELHQPGRDGACAWVSCAVPWPCHSFSDLAAYHGLRP